MCVLPNLLLCGVWCCKRVAVSCRLCSDWKVAIPTLYKQHRMGLAEETEGSQSCFDTHSPCPWDLYGSCKFDSAVYDKSYLYIVVLLVKRTAPLGPRLDLYGKHSQNQAFFLWGILCALSRHLWER